jgi:hypothetical protein
MFYVSFTPAFIAAILIYICFTPVCLLLYVYYIYIYTPYFCFTPALLLSIYLIDVILIY